MGTYQQGGHGEPVALACKTMWIVNNNPTVWKLPMGMSKQRVPGPWNDFKPCGTALFLDSPKPCLHAFIVRFSGWFSVSLQIHTSIQPWPNPCSKYGIILLFFMAEQYSLSAYLSIYIHIHYNFFNHSPVDGHLGCFHVLAINNAAVNTEMHVSFWLRVFIFSSYVPRNEIPESNMHCCCC